MWRYLVDHYWRPWPMRILCIVLFICLATQIAFSPMEVGSPVWKR